jgi:hypothetical protein
MLVGLVIITSSGLAVPAGAQEPATKGQVKPKKTSPDPPVTELTLDFHEGRPIVEAKINGQGPFKLALRIESGGTTIRFEVVQALKLGTETERTESKSTIVTRLDSVALGDTVFRNVKATVGVARGPSGERPPYDGSLGLSVFSGHLLTIDSPRWACTIQQGELPKADGKAVFDYKLHKGLVSIPVTFGDVPVPVGLDGTAPDWFALTDTLKGNLVVGPAPVPAALMNMDGERYDGLVEDSVRIGRHQILQSPVRFVSGDSVMGRELLAEFVLTFDHKHSRVRFARKETNPVAFEPPRPKFGLEVEEVEGRLVASVVEPGSPAERAGVHVSDILLYVNQDHARLYDVESFTVLMTQADIIDLKLQRGRPSLFVRMVAN